MSKVYGYARISTKQQNIERQVRNIKAEYPEAVIIKEAYTGTKVEGRTEFVKLMKAVKAGDTVIFDSVSRMSRSAAEGYTLYKECFDKGIELVFLKEHYIDTRVYASKLQQADVSTGKTYLDEGLKVILMGLAKEQIQIAFEQAEKEVSDLHQRTKEGIETARINGKQIGQKQGNKLTVKKAAPAKRIIREYSKTFGGNMTDEQIMKLAEVSKPTLYKYKKEIAAEMQQEQAETMGRLFGETLDSIPAEM